MKTLRPFMSTYNRIYDINTGRWTSPDPAASPWSNLQDYVGGNPISRSDPSGLLPDNDYINPETGDVTDADGNVDPSKENVHDGNRRTRNELERVEKLRRKAARELARRRGLGKPGEYDRMIGRAKRDYDKAIAKCEENHETCTFGADAARVVCNGAALAAAATAAKFCSGPHVLICLAGVSAALVIAVATCELIYGLATRACDDTYEKCKKEAAEERDTTIEDWLEDHS